MVLGHYRKMPRSDLAASMLLCSEDSTAIFDLEEESEDISWVLRTPSRHADASSGCLLIDFPLQSESFIDELLEREEGHLPMEGYAQRLLQQPGGLDLVAVRSAAIDWIWKVTHSLLISLNRGVQDAMRRIWIKVVSFNASLCCLFFIWYLLIYLSSAW